MNISIIMIFRIIIAFFVVIPPVEASASSVASAKVMKAKVQLELIEVALYKFGADMKRLPTSDEGLNTLIEPRQFNNDWKGPYITKRKIPKDPWGNEYRYIYPAKYKGERFDLYSLGIDGIDDLGGKDDIFVGQDINYKYYRTGNNYLSDPIALLYIFLVFDFPLALLVFIAWKVLKKRRSTQPGAPPNPKGHAALRIR